MTAPTDMADIDFMREMAKFWRKEVSKTNEDRTHWAALHNAENCERIADKMESEYLPF